MCVSRKKSVIAYDGLNARTGEGDFELPIENSKTGDLLSRPNTTPKILSPMLNGWPVCYDPMVPAHIFTSLSSGGAFIIIAFRGSD